MTTSKDFLTVGVASESEGWTGGTGAGMGDEKTAESLVNL